MVVLASSLWSSGAVLADTKNFEGLSAGVNLNLISGGVKITNGADSIDSFGGKQTMSGSLDLAYGIKVGNTGIFTLGVEFDLSKPTLFSSVESGNTLSIKQGSRYGIYIAPGTALNKDTLLYGRIGFHKLKGEILDSVDGDVSQKFSGFSYGLGIKTMLSKDAFIKVEANRLTYGSETADGIQLKPSATAGTIGIGINF